MVVTNHNHPLLVFLFVCLFWWRTTYTSEVKKHPVFRIYLQTPKKNFNCPSNHNVIVVILRWLKQNKFCKTTHPYSTTPSLEQRNVLMAGVSWGIVLALLTIPFYEIGIFWQKQLQNNKCTRDILTNYYEFNLYG